MTAHTEQSNKIAKSAGTVGIAVFASRILGLVREQVFAILFGAGHAYDAFVVAYRVPNLLRDLFAEGALSSAFVAVFTDYRYTRTPAETWRLAGNVITVLCIVVGAITLTGIFWAEDIVLLMTEAGFAAVPGKVQLTTDMTSIMFPFLLLVSLSALAMGILNAVGVFFIPALASSFFNLGSILTGLTLVVTLPRFGIQPIIGMAIGVLAGGVLQIAVQIPSLRRHGFRFIPCVDFSDPGLRRILRLMVPALVGLSVTQVNIFINTYFASSCPAGSLSWLQYAMRLWMFPVGVVGVSLSVATMPVVSRHAARGDMEQLRQAYVSSLVLCAVVAVPATLGLIVLAGPLVRLIFQHGNFTAADTLNTSRALVLYAAALLSYTAWKITVPVFYAIDKPRFPVMASCLSIACNVTVVWTTIGALQFRAIPLALAVSITFNLLFLSTVLYVQIDGFAVRPIATCLAKVLPLALLMAAGTVWLYGRLCTLWGEGVFEQATAVLLSVCAGAVFYGSAVSMVGIPEIVPLRNKALSLLPGRRT